MLSEDDKRQEADLRRLSMHPVRTLVRGRVFCCEVVMLVVVWDPCSKHFLSRVASHLVSRLHEGRNPASKLKRRG